jgi:hypothetical protein
MQDRKGKCPGLFLFCFQAWVLNPGPCVCQASACFLLSLWSFLFAGPACKHTQAPALTLPQRQWPGKHQTQSGGTFSWPEGRVLSSELHAHSPSSVQAQGGLSHEMLGHIQQTQVSSQRTRKKPWSQSGPLWTGERSQAAHSYMEMPRSFWSKPYMDLTLNSNAKALRTDL